MSHSSPSLFPEILVTGASGFVGKKLVKKLTGEGIKVRAQYLSRGPAATDLHPLVEWVQADLLDVYAVEELMEGIQKIFHCAAVISYQPHDRKKMLHTNVETTSNMVNMAIVKGNVRMIYLSSIAALSTPANGAATTEEELWEESAHRSAYGLSKHLAEREVWRGIGEGMSAAILNPGVILGTGGDYEKGSVQLMTLAAKAFPFYALGQTGFVDVDDLVKAMTLLMSSNIQEERFILIENNYTFREMMSRMAAALGTKAPTRKGKTWMVQLLWRWEAFKAKLIGKNPSITEDSARTAQATSYYSNEKWKQHFSDFKFKKMEATLSAMADEYRSIGKKVKSGA